MKIGRSLILVMVIIAGAGLAWFGLRGLAPSTALSGVKGAAASIPVLADTVRRLTDQLVETTLLSQAVRR